MARIVNSSTAPKLSLVIQTVLQNGSVLKKRLNPGDIVENLRYVENGEIKTVTKGRMIEVSAKFQKSIRKYNNPDTLRSYFAKDVLPDVLYIDCSEQYHSDIREIPVREIIEDNGVENVERMKNYLIYTADFHILLSNDEVFDFNIEEGQIAKGLTYLHNGAEIVCDAEVVVMRYDANLYPTNLVVFDGSTSTATGKKRIIQIDIMSLKSVQSVENKNTPDDNINDLIDGSYDGVIFLTNGTYNQDIHFNKDIVINGVNRGVSGKTRVINSDGTKNDLATLKETETVLPNKITVDPGVSVVLDGVYLTKDAFLYFDHSPQVILKNCIIGGLAGETSTSFMVQFANSESPIQMKVSNCYFADNTDSSGFTKIKNGFEMTGVLANGSYFNDNYFERSVCRNNIINLYNLEDGGKFYVMNNIFEYSGNAIRVATMGDKIVTIFIDDNEYLSTEEAYPEYAGLLLIQPYAKMTDTFERNTIILNANTHPDDKQLFYLYYGANDTQITPDKRPTVIVDGKVVMYPIPANDEDHSEG